MSSSPFVLLTGPYYLGNLLNWGLLGVLTVQVYSFYGAFPNERAWVKAFVYTLFLLNVLHAAFATYSTWNMLVAGWGDPAVLATVDWSGCVQPIATGIISGMVQLYFAWRIWILKQGNRLAQVISVLIVLIALMQSLSAIVNGIRFALVRDVSEMVNLTAGVQVWLGGSVACDVLISGTMIVILSKARRNSQWKQTNDILKRLILQTVETGTVTTVTAILDLVLFLVYTDNNLHLLPSIPLGKIYACVALTTLNARSSSSAPGGAGSRSRSRSGGVSTVESHQMGSFGVPTRPTDVERGVVSGRTVIHVSTDVTRDQGLDMNKETFKAPDMADYP